MPSTDGGRPPGGDENSSRRGVGDWVTGGEISDPIGGGDVVVVVDDADSDGYPAGWAWDGCRALLGCEGARLPGRSMGRGSPRPAKVGVGVRSDKTPAGPLLAAVAEADAIAPWWWLPLLLPIPEEMD